MTIDPNIKVAGIWETGWNVPLSESYLWSFPLREFGVAEWAMSPVTGITHNEKWSGMNLTEYEEISDMVEKFSEGYTRVFIDEKGSIPLHEFEHPEKAVYFFGKAGRTPAEYKKEGDLSVKIITVANNGVMWPHQCLVAVLHDRLVKSWR